MFSNVKDARMVLLNVPFAMTAITAANGLLPAALSHRIGGLITATVTNPAGLSASLLCRLQKDGTDGLNEYRILKH